VKEEEEEEEDEAHVGQSACETDQFVWGRRGTPRSTNRAAANRPTEALATNSLILLIVNLAFIYLCSRWMDLHDKPALLDDSLFWIL
jgi:hypothetical protein